MTFPERIGTVLLILVVALIPLVMAGDVFSLSIMAYTWSFAIFAMGLYVMFAWTGEIPLGLGLFYGFGAYASALLMKDVGLSFLTATFISVIGAVILALGVGLVTLRLTGAYFAIVSWGLSAVAVVVVNQSDELTGGALGLFGIPPAEIGPLQLSNPATYAAVSGASLLVVLLALAFLRNTNFGTRLAGIRRNARLARSVGIDVFHTKVAAFGISAGLAAVSGCLSVTYLSILVPSTLSVTVTVEGLVMVLLGGVGFLVGPILGSIFFIVLPEQIELAADTRQFVFAIIIIVIMVAAPGGLPELVDKVRHALRTRRNDPHRGDEVSESSEDDDRKKVKSKT